MWGKWGTKLAIALLSSARLSVEDRQILTSALLTKLGALPLRARITVDEKGQVFVDGKQLKIEVARKLHESSKAMLNNFARKFVRDTVTFEAIRKGVHENTSPEQGLFAKAALWFINEENDLYLRFAQVELDSVE